MIPVDSLLYKIDQKLNKLSSNAHQKIQLEDKILALNEAQIELIKQRFTEEKHDGLQNLVVEYIDGKVPLIETNSDIHQWDANISLLSPKYMFYVDSYVLADKGECKNRTIWVNKNLTKHASLQFLLNSTHYKPSFEYQETFLNISSDELNIYTDGTFTPKDIYTSYVRYPIYIDKEGYVKFDGSSSSNVDCELELFLEDELLDITVQALAEYTENIAAVQAAQLRIQTNE